MAQGQATDSSGAIKPDGTFILTGSNQYPAKSWVWKLKFDAGAPATVTPISCGSGAKVVGGCIKGTTPMCGKRERT